MNEAILRYYEALAPDDPSLCEHLAAAIERGLPGGEGKVWHGHPVWFVDGNPIVGYGKLKDAVRLLFWSGRSFDEPELQPEGTLTTSIPARTSTTSRSESFPTRSSRIVRSSATT